MSSCKTDRQKCIDQWTWIAGQPDGTTKLDWWIAHQDTDLDPLDAMCYACKFDRMSGNHDCIQCPIDWGYRPGYVQQDGWRYEHTRIWCTDLGSPFFVFDRRPTKENALAILKCIEETWE